MTQCNYKGPLSLFVNKAVGLKLHFIGKQSKTGLFNYIVLHCIDFDDVNLTISQLDRPTPAEFTKGFSMMTSISKISAAVY